MGTLKGWMGLAALNAVVAVVVFCAGCASGGSACLKLSPNGKPTDESIKACESDLNANKGRQDYFSHYARTQLNRGDYNKVLAWGKEILTDDSSRKYVQYFIGVAYRKLGQCNEAISAYQEYAKSNAKDPDPYFGMGLCYEDLGNRGEAAKAFQAYVDKEKRLERKTWKRTARDKVMELGGVPKVVAAVPKVAVTVPKPKPVTQPKPVPSSNGDPSAPVEEPGGITETTSPPPMVPPPQSVSKPVVVTQSECAAFEKAIKADPFATNAYESYVKCASKAGKHEDVKKMMRTAIRDNPEYHRGWLHLGEAHNALGERTEAEAAFVKACKGGVVEACGR